MKKSYVTIENYKIDSEMSKIRKFDKHMENYMAKHGNESYTHLEAHEIERDKRFVKDEVIKSIRMVGSIIGHEENAEKFIYGTKLKNEEYSEDVLTILKDEAARLKEKGENYEWLGIYIESLSKEIKNSKAKKKFLGKKK